MATVYTSVSAKPKLKYANPSGPPAGNEPSDPIGRVSLFNAIEKQLGLKQEEHKRSYLIRW